MRMNRNVHHENGERFAPDADAQGSPMNHFQCGNDSRSMRLSTLVVSNPLGRRVAAA